MKQFKNFSMLLLVWGLACPVWAGDVTMKTSKAVGETISIAVNADVPFTITWGNGDTDETISTGQLQSFTVKDASLTLSTPKSITSLYVAENGLVELNVTGISSTLRRLFCADNELSSLNVAGCTELVSLDCQGNNIRSISVISQKVVDLNIADNQLATNGLRSGLNVTSLVCANNRITALSYLSSMTGLTTLFFQGNNVTAAGTSQNKELIDVLGFDNNLSSMNAKPLVKLQNLWLANNKLTSLDLSEAASLASLSVENNNLAELLTTKSSQATFKQIDISNNNLFLNSFPTVYLTASKVFTMEGALTPQAPFALLPDMNVNERSESLTTLLARNAWGSPTLATLKFQDADGNELESGTDYTFSGYRVTFLKAPKNPVVGVVTSASYPDIELYTAPFNVSDPSGIELAESDQGDALAGQPVYDLSGRRVASQLPATAATSALKKGIYVIGGRKVVVR